LDYLILDQPKKFLAPLSDLEFYSLLDRSK